jgi:hypothetical protein
MDSGIETLSILDALCDKRSARRAAEHDGINNPTPGWRDGLPFTRCGCPWALSGQSRSLTAA